MRCEDLPEESYAFFVLGASASPECELIERHLRERCEHCAAEVAAYREIWHAVSSECPPQTPPHSLRRRVIEATAGVEQSWLSRPFAAFSLVASLATAAILIAGFVYTGRLLQPPPRIVFSPVYPGAPPVAPAPLPSSGARPDSGMPFDAELARLRNDLAREREKTSLLEIQIEQARSERASVEKPAQQQPASLDPNADIRRYREALAAAEAQRDSLTARLSATLTRVSTLENEVAQYKQLLDLERRRADRQVSIASIVTSPALRVIELKGTERDPRSQGRLLLAGTSRMLFTAFDLPQLPANRVYQLWLLRSAAPAIASAGTFQPDQTRQAVLQSNDSAILSGITAVAVTDEPAGGSPQPTGHKWIVGL